MSPRLKDILATAFCSVGLALALYLALLKYFSLPCIGGGNCQAVIHSRYGSALGIPVGVFGAILWIGAIVVRDETKRTAVLCLLSVGAAIFMILQFFVLRGFCLYCTAHALCAWAALSVRAASPARFSLAIGLALAFGGFQFARSQVQAKVAQTLPAAAADTAAAGARSAGVPWLGPLSERSPTLVLSLNCPACLDLMEELTRRNYSQVAFGPAVLFKTNDDNRALTTTFIAAVLAQEGDRRDAFLAVSALFLMRKDTALSNPRAAGGEMAAIFPAALAKQPEAAQLVDKQTRALSAAGLGETTPLLLVPNEKPSAFFKTDDLFR